MTKVEQYLTMVNREVAAMARDQLGSDSRTRFADRVIADVCGIESFASMVLASRNPKAVILNAIRSSRGECLMRFFSEKMHDARQELVDVLIEAVRMSDVRVDSDADTHNYLQKLYEKAVKKTRKLVGSKTTTKIRFNTKYPALSKITGTYESRRFDYFSDDEEDEGDDSYSNYVDDYFEALATGKEPPKPIAYGSKEPDMDLDVDPDILRLIDNIQRRLGRRLSSAEIADIIRNAEDEDEPEVPGGEAIVGLDPKTQKLVDAVANVVVAKLMTQGAIDPSKAQPVTDFDPDEIRMTDNLDEFLNGAAKEPGPVKVSDSGNPMVIPMSIRVDTPIAEKSSDDNISTEKLISVVNGVDKDETKGENDPSSDIIPPVDEAGGVISESKPLAAKPDEDLEDDSDFHDERLIDRRVRHVLDVIRPQFVAAVKTFVAAGNAEYVDLVMSLSPNLDEDFLFEYRVRLLINGDTEEYNILRFNTIASRFVESISIRLGIPSSLINLRLYLVNVGKTDSAILTGSVVDNVRVRELFCQATNLFDTDIDDLDSTICGIALRIYKETHVLSFVTRRILPEEKLVTFIVGIKKNQRDPGADVDKAKTIIEQCMEDISCDWVTYAGLDYAVGAHFYESENAIDILRGYIIEGYSGSDKKTFRDLTIKMTSLLAANIKCAFRESYGVNSDALSVDGSPDFSEIGNGVALDLYYSVGYPKDALTVEQETEFINRFSRYYIYGYAIEDLLYLFCNSLFTDTFLRLVEEPYTEADLNMSQET